MPRAPHLHARPACPAPLSLVYSPSQTWGALCGSVVSTSVAVGDLGVPRGNKGEVKWTHRSPLPPSTPASRRLSLTDIEVSPQVPLSQGSAATKCAG